MTLWSGTWCKLVIWLCDIWHLLMTICCESSTILKNVIEEYVVNMYLLIVLLYLNKPCKYFNVLRDRLYFQDQRKFYLLHFACLRWIIELSSYSLPVINCLKCRQWVKSVHNALELIYFTKFLYFSSHVEISCVYILRMWDALQRVW